MMRFFIVLKYKNVEIPILLIDPKWVHTLSYSVCLMNPQHGQYYILSLASFPYFPPWVLSFISSTKSWDPSRSDYICNSAS